MRSIHSNTDTLNKLKRLHDTPADISGIATREDLAREIDALRARLNALEAKLQALESPNGRPVVP